MARHLVFCLVGLASCGPTLLGMEYRFQPLNFPGAAETYAHGINDSNVVVGGFADADEATFGFVWQDGTFTSPDLDVEETFFNGINNVGTIVGVGIDPFVFAFPSFTLAGEQLSTFTYPEALFTFADGINDQDEIVGVFIEGFDDEELFRSFRKRGDMYEELVHPDGWEVLAVDVNNRGQIVGGVYDLDGRESGFLFDDDGWQLLNHPDGETELLGVNDAGWVVGSVDDGGLRSFVFDGSVFHDVAFPGAVDTAVWGINNEGVLVGEFLASEAEQFQGFIAWPVPEPRGLWLLVWGACLGLMGRRSSRLRP